MPSMVKQNRMLLKKAENHPHPGSVPSQWQWTPVLTGQPGCFRSSWRAFIITLSAGQKTKHICNFWSFLSHHMLGKNISSTSWHALWSWALPLLSIRATLHLVCPSQTYFHSWKHYLHTLCLLSLATTPSPQPFSLHSFPRGACPFSQLPGIRGQRFGEPGWPAWCTKLCLGSSWAAWTALAGAASGRQLLTGSDPICVWRKGPSIASEAQQWYLPCYCTGAFSGSISLAFMQSSVDRNLNTSSKHHYCYCTSDGYSTDIFQACTINNLQR